jgi:hypothetical protein
MMMKMKKILNKDLHMYLKVAGMIFLATLIFGYALFQARNIILGPVIEIRSPENGASMEESLIEIKGKVKNISRISMNGNQIFTDSEGMFSEKLLLSYGYNIITIKVMDRFDREIEKVLELIYK